MSHKVIELKLFRSFNFYIIIKNKDGDYKDSIIIGFLNRTLNIENDISYISL